MVRYTGTFILIYILSRCTVVYCRSILYPCATFFIYLQRVTLMDDRGYIRSLFVKN